MSLICQQNENLDALQKEINETGCFGRRRAEHLRIQS